ncbi:MAG: hypothetical protein ACI4T7_07410, partial [Alloprevotella sp.]
MRKFTQAMLVLLAFLGSTIGAVAQNYPVAVDATATITREGRSYTGITLQPERGVKQTINVKDGNYVYNDMTSTANGTFTAKVGQTVAARFLASYENWMHSFIFIDKGNDGQFNVSSLQASDDDLFEYCRFGNLGDGSQPRINSIPTFSLPTTAGTYRMRYLVYWSSTSGNALANTPVPAGNTGMIGDGGIVVDVTLQVLGIDVNFVDNAGNALEGGSYESDPVCGQAFTFSVPSKAGYATSVAVKCGANFSEDQASETISWYTGANYNSPSTTPTSTTFYNWEQITPTDNGNGTYTVPADKMKGDLQITVTYTKDVMALIKAGKQVFRIKNVGTASYPYLKVATADASSGSRFSQGDKILYHVNAETATADGASCLWRLMPAGTNQYYLRSQCLTLSDMKTTNSSGSVNSDYPVKMDAAYDSEGNPQGQIIYLHQTGSNYGFSTSSNTAGYNFMHAVDFGGQDNTRGQYPATDNGYYVTTWNKSATPSQWTLEEVNEIGITIGASGYASVNYDFPVKFPAGVKVYKKAQEAATYIQLEEIPAGSDGRVSLPTGNAAFVAGTEDASITLEILLDEPAAIDGGTGVNGTYLATTFDATSAANIYGIAKVDDVVA